MVFFLFILIYVYVFLPHFLNFYRDGTTDVTRTMHFGTPTPAQIEAFTLVLKGQIALGISVFPSKIKVT